MLEPPRTRTTAYNGESTAYNGNAPRIMRKAPNKMPFDHFIRQLWLSIHCCGASEPEASERSSSLICAERGF
jgi:hypothetical protein